MISINCNFEPSRSRRMISLACRRMDYVGALGLSEDMVNFPAGRYIDSVLIKFKLKKDFEVINGVPIE